MTPEAECQLSEEVARKLRMRFVPPTPGYTEPGWFFANGAELDWYGGESDPPSFREPDIVCAMIEWLIGRGKCFGFIPRDERCECEIESDPRSPYSDGDVSCSGNTWQEALARAFLAAQE